MSDWDDDDFGGFESADVGVQGVVETKDEKQDDAVAADLSSNPGIGGNAQLDILDWILSNNAKSDTSGGTEIVVPQSPSASRSQDRNDENGDTPSTPKSQSLEQADNSLMPTVDPQTIETRDLPAVEPSAINWSKEFSSAKENIESLTSEESQNIHFNNDAIHKLQAELDAALIMKEQSEKSLETMKKELMELTVAKKNELDEKDHQLEEEISQLKQQHQLELAELTKLSEQTIQKLMSQNTEIWKTIEKEKSSECESVATSIVEKCVELMNQQHALLCKQLDESREKHEKSMKDSFENEQEILSKNVQTKLDEGKENIEEDLKKTLSENMHQEAKKLQKLHSQTLKEAMTKQQTHFEEALQSMLMKEREKFTETLKEAVNEAQSSTERELERRRMAEKSRMKTHNLSLKMLLSSALQQVEEQYNFDNGAESSGEGS